jgi:hypothetical protein
MQKKVRVHGAHLAGGARVGSVPTLDANPGLGYLVTFGDDTLLYTVIDGIEAYYPIVKGAETASFRQSYPTSSLVWELEHNLGTKDFFMVIKDHEDNVIMTYQDLEYAPGNELNKITVMFSEPIRGTAFLVASKSLSTPRLNTSEIAFSEDFVINASGFIVNGQAVSITAVASTVADIALANTKADTAITTANLAKSRADAAILTADAASLQVSNQASSISNALTIANAAKSTADAAALEAAGSLKETAFLSTWATYDLGFGTDDPVTSGLNIGAYTIARKSVIPANFAGSIGRADTPPATATSFTLQRNGIAVGTISIAAGASQFTFSAQTAIALAVGDRVKAIANNADSALRGFDFTIVNNLVK